MAKLIVCVTQQFFIIKLCRKIKLREVEVESIKFLNNF